MVRILIDNLNIDEFRLVEICETNSINEMGAMEEPFCPEPVIEISW